MISIPGRRIQPDEIVVTSPFSRRGDGLFLRAQLIAVNNGTGNLSIAVETRNTEDAWSGTALATTAFNIQTASAGEFKELHIPVSSGIKEQLRLKVSGPEAGWGVIRVFSPVFYDTAVT